MPYLAFVGPALRFLNRGIEFVAGKSDANPKTSGLTAIIGAGATWAGFRPEDVAVIGKALVALGKAMGG